MSTAAQVVVVIVTIAMVLLAWWATAWMRRLEELGTNVRSSLDRIEESIHETHGKLGAAMSLLGDLRERADAVTATAVGVERAGDRAARILSYVLGGFERPTHHAIGVARGVRAGMRYWKEGRKHDHVGFEPSERV